MKERPIIYNAEMVRATLEDRKTKTRRVIKPQPTIARVIDIHAPRGMPRYSETDNYVRHPDGGYAEIGSRYGLSLCPYGQVGDRLWVRETFAYESPDGDRYVAVIPNETKIYYHATDEWEGVRVPSIFMPRWASRITLEITGIGVERLQEITEEDVLAEGITVMQGTWQSKKWNEKTRKLELTGERHPYTGRYHFEVLWNTINPKYPWESNPWVWVISFKKV